MFQDLPFGMITATNATRAHLYSARPDAPVVPDVERTGRLAPLRARMAATLHRTADRVAPAPAPCLPTHA
jgi:hypothetical protein